LSLASSAAHLWGELLPPPIEWQQTFGGTENDYLYSVKQIADGGFILGGTSYSPAGGNKTATNISASDYWLVRLDQGGTKIWDKVFGGTAFDYLNSLQQTTDGGIVVGGMSQSGISGTKTSPHFGTAVSGDFWVVRIDPDGNKIWEQDFGGDFDDIMKALQQTADGRVYPGWELGFTHLWQQRSHEFWSE